MTATRDFDPHAAAGLKPGDAHYRAFVGPPGRYDLMGASQFALLFLMGLRERHRLLDFGCGSLRLGRLAIPYLLADRYFGIEPEAWLVAEGFERELGEDARTLKRPRFDHNREYRADVFGEAFDYIVAQSVFSHTGEGPMRQALASFAACLAPNGLILANWMIGEEGPGRAVKTSQWVYPQCVRFSPNRIARAAAEHGLVSRRLSWPHPALTWHVLARSADALPPDDHLAAVGATPPAWSGPAAQPQDIVAGGRPA